MAYNYYIAALQSLRKDIENRIDNEIEECMKGRGDSSKLKDSIEYLIENSPVLNGMFKDEESIN